LDRQQVIFVETQGQVLNRLKTSLMGTHADWQILFMADASAALDLISRRTVGIVLANFGMDNAGCEEFFRRLRKKAPEVIRISLLPDQAKESVAKSLEYAHQCIAAHCDISQMEIVIARSLYVWGQARRNPRLAELISNQHTIPTPPAIYFEIRDEVESPRGTKAVCVAESMLQGHNLNEGTELTDTEGQADTPSMFDGLVQWKPLMEKFVEQGLIQPPRDPVESLMG